MSKYYAGIGSRETPDHVCNQMTKIATFLETKGFVLNSGGAPKADHAFEIGVEKPENKNIFVPWYNFNDTGSAGKIISPTTCHNYLEMERISKHFHPAWFRLKDAAQKLMIRNVPQVLGRKLAPESYVKFVIAWTKDGKDTGGTGQALRIAKHYNIPIYNLFNPTDVTALGEYLRSL